MNCFETTSRCWTEINLNHLLHNMNIIKSKLSENEEIIAVVKADAYGCGAVKIANFLQKTCAIKNWAVATIKEAIELREANIAGDILIFGYTLPSELGLLHKYDLSQSVFSVDYALELKKKLAESNIKLKIQIAIDSGMNRVGFHPSENFLNYLPKDNFKIDGIFTHLCCADSYDNEMVNFTKKQIAIFKSYATNFKKVHCKNSAAIIRNIANGFNFVRPGIIMYGLQPSEEIQCSELIPIMSFKSRIIMVKSIKKGETVGYSRNFQSKTECKIATVSVGYADGYSRLLSNKGLVSVNGKIAKVIGNVCMDYIMLDITNIEASPGDTVILFGNGINFKYTADYIAKQTNTIGYEVMCDVSKRVEKIYKY